MKLLLLPFAFCILHCATGAAGDDAPPDPETERKSFKVAAGFEVSLYAADPLINKPVRMNFDPQGRLWIASSSTYPQIKPGQAKEDKVLILEDKDGDGKAETVTVFVDGLLIPTGVEPGDGGVYVANSTELVHYKDTDGDGKADTSRVVLSGFGTEDTHHLINSFRWGPDGCLYFNQAIYIHSHVETPNGTVRHGGGGIWRFRPGSWELEVYCKGMCNPWGHAFDAWGQQFGTDGAGGDGIHYLMPGATYPHYPGGGKIFPGLNPNSPKMCGAEIVSGRHLPDDWQGNILANDFRANKINRFALSEDSSGFASKKMPDLITSTDRAFRPIDIKMGPDGAIYIADWYNPIINHGEVDFRDPRRDRVHGRIWRVTAKDRPLVKRPELFKASIKEVLEQLKSPEGYTRHQAKRTLNERGAQEVLPALAQWVAGLDAKDANFEHNRLEALWAYETMNTIEPKLLEAIHKSPEPKARVAATRTLAHWQNKLPNALSMLAAAAADEHPRVRLEAVRTAKAIGTAEAFAAVLAVLEKPMDRFLDYALALTANEMKPVWMPAFQEGKIKLPGKQAEYAMKAVQSGEAIKAMVQQIKGGHIPVESREGMLDIIVSAGNAADLGEILNLALSGKPDDPMKPKLLAGLGRAAAQRKLKPAGDVGRIKSLFAQPNESVKIEAIRLAGSWKVEPARADITALAVATEESPVRLAAIAALGDLGGPASAETLKGISESKSTTSTRFAATAALASVDVKSAATLAADLFAAPAIPADATAQLFSAFLKRAEGTDSLAAALAGKTIPPDAAKLGIRATQEAGQNDSALIATLRKCGALTDEPKELSKDEMTQMIALVAKGNAANGKVLFQKKEMACVQCHTIAGKGGNVGPDISSVGSSAPVDYLIESVLFPNKAVKENFNAVTVATKDGRVLTGVKLRENSTEIALRDASGQEIVIATANINKKKDVGSIMPSGLAEMLTKQELLDLVKYMTELKGN